MVSHSGDAVLRQWHCVDKREQEVVQTVKAKYNSTLVHLDVCFGSTSHHRMRCQYYLLLKHHRAEFYSSSTAVHFGSKCPPTGGRGLWKDSSLQSDSSD